MNLVSCLLIYNQDDKKERRKGIRVRVAVICIDPHTKK
jgi:hypothetical protein